MSAILLESEIVHYEVIGRGRPIIFLHSWFGSWRYWIPALQSAGMNFRAYALDLWGFGDSSRNRPDRYSLEWQIKLIDQFMQEMGIGKIAIVGHGLGAVVGLHFTMRFPNLVDRVMAIGAPLEPAHVNPRLATEPMASLLETMLGKNDAAEPVRTDSSKADSSVVMSSLASPDYFNVKEKLLGMNNACLLVYGQNDPIITTSKTESSDMRTIAPMVHLMVLDQANHYVMLDDTPRFNRLLTDFLALQSGESPSDLQFKDEWKRRVR